MAAAATPTPAPVVAVDASPTPTIAATADNVHVAAAGQNVPQSAAAVAAAAPAAAAAPSAAPAVAVDFRHLPDLSSVDAEPIEMSGEYWTPSAVGESKRLFFVGLNTESVVDMATGETRELLVAQFAENNGGVVRAVRNGSRRLVGIFESFAASIKTGDAFEITYLGKRKNANNNFFSDNWSVKRLILK